MGCWPGVGGEISPLPGPHMPPFASKGLGPGSPTFHVAATAAQHVGDERNRLDRGLAQGLRVQPHIRQCDGAAGFGRPGNIVVAEDDVVDPLELALALPCRSSPRRRLPPRPRPAPAADDGGSIEVHGLGAHAGGRRPRDVGKWARGPIVNPSGRFLPLAGLTNRPMCAVSSGCWQRMATPCPPVRSPIGRASPETCVSSSTISRVGYRCRCVPKQPASATTRSRTRGVTTRTLRCAPASQNASVGSERSPGRLGPDGRPRPCGARRIGSLGKAARRRGARRVPRLLAPPRRTGGSWPRPGGQSCTRRGPRAAVESRSRPPCCACGGSPRPLVAGGAIRARRMARRSGAPQGGPQAGCAAEFVSEKEEDDSTFSVHSTPAPHSHGRPGRGTGAHRSCRVYGHCSCA